MDLVYNSVLSDGFVLDRFDIAIYAAKFGCLWLLSFAQGSEVMLVINFVCVATDSILFFNHFFLLMDIIKVWLGLKLCRIYH